MADSLGTCEVMPGPQYFGSRIKNIVHPSDHNPVTESGISYTALTIFHLHTQVHPTWWLIFFGASYTWWLIFFGASYTWWLIFQRAPLSVGMYLTSISLLYTPRFVSSGLTHRAEREIYHSPISSDRTDHHHITKLSDGGSIRRQNKFGAPVLVRPSPQVGNYPY